VDIGRGVLKLLVGVTALGLVAGGAVAVRAIGDTDCGMPVVVGRSADSAREVLATAEVDAANVTQIRVADAMPQGLVVRQSPSRCSGLVELIVSDGGPVLSAREVPEPYLRLLGDPEGDQLVRRITTPYGDAYKIDEFLVGDCEATRIAVEDVADDDFDVRCRPPLEERLLQVLLSSTTTWWGEPPSGGGGARSGIAENYMGTAWGARLRIDGWELQVDVTISASREAGPGPLRKEVDLVFDGEAPSDRVRRAVLTVAASSDNVVVNVWLIPPRTLPSDFEEPATLEELRALVDELLVLAKTG